MYTPCKDHSEGRGAALIYIVINAFLKGHCTDFTHESQCAHLDLYSAYEKIKRDATMLFSVVRHLVQIFMVPR